MATKFGIELRKLRIDLGENLQIMSKKLKISTSYLSSIENGRRNIPKALVGRISRKYHLDQKQVDLLEKAKDESTNELSIDLSKLSKNQKDFMMLLSRKLPEIDNTDDLIQLLIERRKDAE